MTADDTAESRDKVDSATDPEGTASEAAGAAADIVVEVEPPADAGRDLEARLAKAEQEKKENWDKLLRATADLENYRRRTKRDLEDARAEAKTRVLKEMLPVVDNLERALAHADDKGADTAAILDGVRLVLRQFGQAFERCDVTAVDAAGQPFDPSIHEAISQQETNAQPPGTVTQVLQKGYRLGERLLRPAMVVVAKSGAAPAPTSDGGAA